MNKSRNGKLKKVCKYHKCTNSSTSNPDLTFFIFPKEPERHAKWVKNAGLSEKDAESKLLYLCEVHFKNIYMCHSKRRKLLLHTAVPYPFDDMQKMKTESESMESLELPESVAYTEEQIVELETMVYSEMDNVEEETTLIHEGMIDQESYSAEPEDIENTETPSESSATFARKRKDPVTQIAEMKAKLQSKKRKTDTTTTGEAQEFTLQLNDGTLIRKLDVSSNQLKSLNHEHEGYRPATAAVAPQESTAESSTKSPATSTNAVEIIEQTEESLSNSSEDEPENVQINEFIFKGEEYVQMPKSFYRKQLEELRRKVARYEHVLQVMRDALDHANFADN